MKKEFQFFATPEKLADELVNLADLKQHDTILEPSAGQGAIVKAINKVCDVVPDCFELMDVNTLVLKKSGFVVKRQKGSHVFPESSDKPRHRERSVAISPFP